MDSSLKLALGIVLGALAIGLVGFPALGHMTGDGTGAATGMMGGFAGRMDSMMGSGFGMGLGGMGNMMGAAMDGMDDNMMSGMMGMMRGRGMMGGSNFNNDTNWTDMHNALIEAYENGTFNTNGTLDMNKMHKFMHGEDADFDMNAMHQRMMSGNLTPEDIAEMQEHCPMH